MPNHATPRLSAGEEEYLRKFYDAAGGRGWNYQTYQKNHSQLLGAVSEGWPAKTVSHTYGDEDHLTRANFEADVHVFGHGKTVAQTLQLNTLLKDAKDFESFKTEASKVLTNFNERNLRTEFDTAKATANATANVLRAVASGAKYMEHRATMDNHTRPVHAALNGKVWRIDDPKDTAWRAWVVPLGWGCRCHDVFTDDAKAGDLISTDDAERLVGPDEMKRLTEDGFLQDRVHKKALFTSRQGYLANLPGGKIAFPINDLTYLDQAQEPWKQVEKKDLISYKPAAKSDKDALADFAATAKDAIKAFTDYRGAPLFLSEAGLKTQVATAAGAEQYFNLEKLVAAPDEVYFSMAGDELTNTYLKFYADDTVLSVEVAYSKDLPQTLQSWRKLPAGKIDAARRGLLIHTSK